jgi:cysteine desulfurase/selenocysteine lyase
MRRQVQADFPFLRETVGKLHYLDNAATTQKPLPMIEAIARYYQTACAQVHRGLYPLAERASTTYEAARRRLAKFIGAEQAQEVILTRSATDSINLVACTWARRQLHPGDLVWVTRMEHHSNFLPWQRVCREQGAELRVIELSADGRLDLDAALELYDTRTRLIAITQVSNVLGIVNPIEQVAARARSKGIAVLVDAAQAAAHERIDVGKLNCDFLAFSAHKMYGPPGIGLLYVATPRLAEMEPLMVRGSMVDEVSEMESTWTPALARFEAGLPDLAGAVGFAAAADYLDTIGIDAVSAHVRALADFAMRDLSKLDAVEVYGPLVDGQRAGIISFNVMGVNPHDVAQAAGEMGVALRAGHHCCQPLMKSLSISGTVRASFAVYNDQSDIDALCAAVQRAQRLLRLE